MRRFGWGATNRPLLKRPGGGYGRLSHGAPGPLQDVTPSEEIVPEMFLENSEEPLVQTRYASDFTNNPYADRADTIIDLNRD